MKTNFSLKNFSIGNTPALIEKIGNYSLIFAVIGTFIIGLPATMEASGITGFVVPAMLLKAAKLCLGIGALIKAVTKLFGQVEEIAKPNEAAK